MNKRGVNLISDALRFHRRRYLEVRHAIGYAEFYSRSRCAVTRVYDAGWQRDRNARAKRRFQRMVSVAA